MLQGLSESQNNMAVLLKQVVNMKYNQRVS